VVTQGGNGLPLAGGEKSEGGQSIKRGRHGSLVVKGGILIKGNGNAKKGRET